MAHKGVSSSLFCLLDILIWAHSLSVGDKATQSERRLDPCFSFILSLKKQQLCLTRFSSVVSYKAKASQRLAGPRIKSSGHGSVWAGTVWAILASRFAPLPLSLIKCGYSLGWDRKTLHSLQLFWFKKRDTLLTQCPVKPFLGVLFYYVIIILILSFNEQQLCLARLISLFNFTADWKQAVLAASLPYTNC